jgi:hypothetical protein
MTEMEVAEELSRLKTTVFHIFLPTYATFFTENKNFSTTFHQLLHLFFDFYTFHNNRSQDNPVATFKWPGVEIHSTVFSSKWNLFCPCSAKPFF